MNIVFLDKQGNVRQPETWEEVTESLCNQWDTCMPCSYSWGWECKHPLHPGNIEIKETFICPDCGKELPISAKCSKGYCRACSGNDF